MISYVNHIINAIKLNISNNENIAKYFNFTYTSQKYMLADNIYYVNDVKRLLSKEEYKYIINPKYKEIKKLTPK